MLSAINFIKEKDPELLKDLEHKRVRGKVTELMDDYAIHAAQSLIKEEPETKTCDMCDCKLSPEEITDNINYCDSCLYS